MTDQAIEIPISLDAAGFVSGAGQLTDSANNLQQSMRGLTVSTGSVQKLFDVVTPGKAAIGAMGAFAAMAANTQQRMSGLSATSAITGVNVNKLGGSIRQMSRDMPMGAKTTTAVVEQFTKMGVAAAGSEKRIGALSKSVLQLAGATGEGPAELAEGMTQLARATGNQSLDPKRFEALGDSLTKVSKESGASAGSILAFSKNIAPMANAAGIGATGVLGISSAFARLGEDGFGASTAVNKMLTDMSRSVREGGPQMRTYAEIVGKSATEFERLYKANPTEALTQVTEAIANAGESGPRMLESIGVEGVRGQRALQALSASGGLRTAVATATSAYGSGDTATAAEAAFGGLNDSLTELRETSTQLSEAMGTPLLGPLTMFTDALKIPVKMLGAVAGSGAGQQLMGAAAMVAIPAMMGKSLLSALTVAGLSRQAGTATPLRALAAGIAQGRGQTTGFMARFGAPIMEAGAEGRMGSYAGRFLNYGQDIGAGMGPAGTGPGGMRQRIVGALSGGAQLNWNMASASLMNAAVNDPTRRSQVGLNAGQAFQGGLGEMRSRLATRGYYRSMEGQWGAELAPGAMGPVGPSGPVSSVAGVGASLKVFDDRLKTAGSSAGVFTKAATSLARVPVAGGAVAGRLGADVGRLAGRGLMAGAGFLGPAAAIGAGIGIWQAGGANQEAQKQAIVDKSQMDIRGTINTYRESIGMATEATQVLGNQLGNLGQSISMTTDTMAEARKITEADIAAAQGKDVQTRYAGTTGQKAAQVGMLNVNGLGARELGAVGQDLLAAGMDPAQVEAILGQVPTGGARRGSGAAQIAEATRGAASSRRGGWKGDLAGLQNVMERGASTDAGRAVGWGLQAATPVLGAITTRMGPGERFHMGFMGDAGKDQASVIEQNIGQRYAAQSDRFGLGYAQQNQARGMEKAVQTALKEGNVDLAQELSKTFSQTLTGVEGGVDLSTQQLRDQGFMGALMAENKDIRKQYADVELRGPGAKAVEQQGYYSKQMQEQGFKQYAGFFDLRAEGGVAGKVARAVDDPESTRKATIAIEGMTKAATKSGKSFDQVALDALNASKKMAETSPQFALMQGVQAKAVQQMQAAQVGMSGGQRLAQNMQYYKGLASIQPETAYQKGKQEEGIAGVTETDQAMNQAMAQRLQQQRQYELQYARAFEDFNQAQEYAEQDYVRSRFRAQRNFNIQIERLREDAAKTLYNPYERIMTQPTWDTNNLLVNMKEQTEALEKQSAQLAQLRKRGVSQQTIDTLELYKPENAQQLNTMTGDLKQDPKLIERLNRQAATRGRAAGDLATDVSSTDVRRMRQDFARGMSDMSKDMDRARDRNQKAFDKGIARMAEDLRRSQEAIAGTTEELARDVDRAIHGKAVHWARRIVDDTQILIDAINNDVAPAVRSALQSSLPADVAESLFRQDASMANRGPATVVNSETGGSMGTTGSSTSVNHSPTTIDNRNDFTGASITVVSNDPDDMARKSAARTRQSNLTRGGAPHSAVQ